MDSYGLSNAKTHSMITKWALHLKKTILWKRLKSQLQSQKGKWIAFTLAYYSTTDLGLDTLL